MAIKQKRDKALKIMMTENTHARLVELGDLLGQPPATLASVAVSQYVQQFMGVQKMQADAVVGIVGAMKDKLGEYDLAGVAQ